jgi:signal transduction histidine kinase
VQIEQDCPISTGEDRALGCGELAGLAWDESDLSASGEAARGREAIQLWLVPPARGQIDLKVLGMVSVSALLLSACLALTGCESHRADKLPMIGFTKIPPAAQGGREKVQTIAGRVTGAHPGQQIVVYVRIGAWWVQPTVASPFTPIRLDGFEQRWSEATTNREATIENLRPGRYRFRVMASNSDGIWNGSEATIAFEVRPTLLQTSWFQAILLLFAGLLALAIYRLRMRHLTGLLNLRFEERLAERTRIARELHDTLLQSFQGLMLRLQAANQILLFNPSEAKEALEGALDRADQALSESRKAIQGIRSDSFSDCDIERALGGLMNELCADAHLTKGKRPMTSVVVEGKPTTVKPCACEEICKIAREALRNAFIHGNAQHIESEVAFSKKFLRVRVRDDGVGIDPTLLEGGVRAGHWGMTGMHERARRLRGHVNVWSKPNTGTEVELTIPASIAFEPVPWRIPFIRLGAGTRFNL